MSAAKHTPGPWRISGFEIRADGDTRVVMGADGFSVCYISGRTKAEHEADAALIAAAPHLLEACKLFAASHSNHELAVALGASQHAIAKAEGRA
jgi:hypothetical protein